VEHPGKILDELDDDANGTIDLSGLRGVATCPLIHTTCEDAYDRESR
jgi:hypothetical protein